MYARDAHTPVCVLCVLCVFRSLTGAWNLDSSVGIYAADPDSYTVFADIMDPVIKDYHRLKSSEAIAHPPTDFGDLATVELSDLDPDNELIVSTRIRVGRSLKDYAFPPVLTKEVSGQPMVCFVTTLYAGTP